MFLVYVDNGPEMFGKVQNRPFDPILKIFCKYLSTDFYLDHKNNPYIKI